MTCARGSDRLGAVSRRDLVEHAMRVSADPLLVAQLADTDGGVPAVAELLGRLLGEGPEIALVPGAPLWAAVRNAEVDSRWRASTAVMPGSLAAQLPDLCAVAGMDVALPREGTWFDVWLAASVRCQDMVDAAAPGAERR